MKINLERVRSDLQEEMCNLQNDPFMLSRTETNAAIFEVMPQDRYPKLIDFALKIKSFFGSTYICESTFSSMKYIKSAQRNTLTNEALEHLLRFATTQIEVDIVKLVSNTKRIRLSH
ncbi:SCAN domain-containing protein 3 [Trachymyrmex cornetzi]|uniref:SCAN domain-containing protein 3 n=1 Tax=Trachymyrmex cornetzi TaxID=471704 RepID=A0A151JMS5_9HYME|nr:SCAN domain-containing protein 3 [Trachymyrmex cornetzi]